jgi:uncharacterized membrane protein YgdD (TMEM256/DUF423 family)
MAPFNSQVKSPLYYILPPLLGLISVATGAFGAHGLEGKIPPQNIEWWQTASDYLMYHSLASLFVISFYSHLPKIRHCTSLFALGSLLFCGSLFSMALTNSKSFALLTPIGGLLYIVGWGYMIWLFLGLRIKTTS